MKRSRKLVRIGSRIFDLQPGEQFAASPPGVDFKPFSQTWHALMSGSGGAGLSSLSRLADPVGRIAPSFQGVRRLARKRSIDFDAATGLTIGWVSRAPRGVPARRGYRATTRPGRERHSSCAATRLTSRLASPGERATTELYGQSRRCRGLYVAPPAKAIVLCVDEKPSIQALERAQAI